MIQPQTRLKVADNTTTSNNEQGVLTYIENNIL